MLTNRRCEEPLRDRHAYMEAEPLKRQFKDLRIRARGSIRLVGVKRFLIFGWGGGGILHYALFFIAVSSLQSSVSKNIKIISCLGKGSGGGGVTLTPSPKRLECKRATICRRGRLA